MVYIYKIENTITGDFYVGATNNLKRRTTQHFLSNPFGHCKKFDDDLKFYGKENFKVSVIEECPDTERCDREQYWLSKLKPAYNVVIRGQERDKAFREKVSSGTKEWWGKLPDETKKKILSQLTGQPVGHEVSQETREKIRKKLLGRKTPREVVEKQRQGIINHWKTHKRPFMRNNKKAVICDGIEYEAIMDCANAIGGKPASIAKAIKRDGVYRGHKVQWKCND